MKIDNDIQISKERQQELIKMMKEAIKEETKVDKLKELFRIIEDDVELDFMYSWLYENNITKEGTNGRRIMPFSLTSEQNLEYAKKMEQGDIDRDVKSKIRDKMIVGNLGFATWYVKNKVPVFLQERIGEEELEQIAAIGIMNAIEKFDYRKGATFISYAAYYIRRAIRDEMKYQDSLYEIPVNKRTAIFSKLNKAENEFEMMNGRKPSSDELVDRMKMSSTKIDELRKIRLRYNMLSTEKLLEEDEENLINSFLDTDRPAELENRMIVDGVYVDEQEEKDNEPVTIEYKDNNPESLVWNSKLKDELANVISTLTERQQDVLIKRFGLGDGMPQTLRAAGKELGFSKNRVSQIEAKALRILRHPSKSRKIKEFIGIEYSSLSAKTVKELLDERRKEYIIETIRDLREEEKELDAQITDERGKKLANKE